jgi:putative tricarboxylic transport membrane protein
MIFGVILGGKIEQSLRQAMTLSSGDALVFLKSPLSETLLALAVSMIALSFWAKRKTAATLQQAHAQPAG